MTTVFSSSYKTLAALLLACAALSAQHAVAAQSKPSKAKQTVKHTVIDNDDVDPDGDEPDVGNSAVADYNCELNNYVTVYKNGSDLNNIALRWKKRVHRLQRVSTTTGADRYENTSNGLTWIVIPAKGLLLHGKKGRQLANECMLKKVVEVTADAKPVPGLATPEPTPSVASPNASPAPGAAVLMAAPATAK
ncbi:MAG TPA: hypothetical protein VIT92_04880 [Burkholderiaceae bacterium]